MNKSNELLVTGLVLPIVKDLLLPKLKQAIENSHIEKKQAKDIEGNIQEYLIKRFEKFQVIDTLAFPNKQTLFDTLYEPLTVKTIELNRKEISIKIKDYPKNFFDKYVRILIEDSAGMGKSTITKKIFKAIIENKISIPVLIELRHINNKNSVLQELQTQLSPLGNQVSANSILKIIHNGGFTFLFDGFDEIAISEKEFVIRDLHDFIQKANNNYFLITSRPENSLTSFGDFQKFTIEPLSIKEAYSLIRKYDVYSHKSIQSKLIIELRKNKEEAINEFLKNPLLVSLLYKSFDYKKDIPVKKTQFYRQIYDALFESHDLSKEGYFKREKNSQLHLDDFERVLRHIGYFTLITNEVEYEINHIINLIEKIKKYVSDLTFKSSDFLKDLLETVPLFKREGNYVKWSHKSLQDYFAAKFIWMDSRENQEMILRKIYSDNAIKRFHNLLDLFYELDLKAFESTILYWLLKEFSHFADSRINLLNDIPVDIKKRRIENNFHKECIIVVTKHGDYDRITKGNSSTVEIIMKGYREKIPHLAEEYDSAYFYYFKKEVFVITFVAENNKIENLLNLISKKKSKLASHKSHNSHVDIELSVLKEDNFYILNYSTENILNRKDIFPLSNNLTIGGHTINYDAALKKLKEIEERLMSNSKDELISW